MWTKVLEQNHQLIDFSALKPLTEPCSKVKWIPVELPPVQKEKVAITFFSWRLIRERQPIMDSLSVCASTIAITAAAQSSPKVLQELNLSWKAPQIINDLTNELENLQSLL